MNQLNGKNNVRQINQPHIKSAQLETMPSLEKNNILSENDEYCYELDQSSYSISDTNKSKKSNNSNTIQMISELSDLSINNNEPLKYINHLPVIKHNEMKNKSININKCKVNKENKKKNDLNNYDENNNISNNSKNSSYNYEMNELNINNNKEDNIDNDNIDNEWNVPKITFSEISKVSKAMSSEGNEGIVDNEDFYTSNNINNINNINNLNIIKDNINIKKSLHKNQIDNNLLNNDYNMGNLGRHKKNIESKISIEENCKTINLLSSQYSNIDFLKQTINNCLLKSGYKEVIDNSQKFLTKSSSLDFLNEYSNVKPENEKIKKNLIMQMVLFTNMKNEMEILKKENDNLTRRLNVFKNEQIKNEKKREEILNENNKRLNEMNYLRNKIKKYKEYFKKSDGLRNEYKNLIKKNEQLIINNDKLITENKKIKEELIKIKKIKKEYNNEKNENFDKEKELNNKIGIILKENKNLNEVMNKQKAYIENLENNINNQKIEISNYIEKMKLLQEKIESKTNSKNKKNNIKLKYLDEQNDLNKEKNIIYLNTNENIIKNKNIMNDNNIIQNLAKNSKKIKMQNNNSIEYYKNKLQEKNKIIEKIKSENLNLIEQNQTKENQIKELLNIKKEYNIVETQNNELKNKLNELNIKYNELIEENNKNNLIKKNLVEQIDKLNLTNKQKENEIFNIKKKTEKLKKKINLSNNTLIEFAKKLKSYASKEFQKTSMSLFLQGFRELIERLNVQKFDDNLEELKGIESICDFINLIPLEIEILYKRVSSLQKDYENVKYHSTKKNIGNNNDKLKNINKTNLYPNAFSDMPVNKKVSKYKANDNALLFRNKEIKIKKLNITDLTNNVNSIKTSIKNSKNKYMETEKNENDNINPQKYTNLCTETIKSSRSDNFKKIFDKKINTFHTIQSNTENIKKISGINLKKFSFNKNNEEKSNKKNLEKKDNIKNNNNNNNNNNVIHRETLSSRRNLSLKENNSSHKNSNKDNDNIIKNYESEKNDFKSIRNKIISNEFHLQSSIKKNIPQKICFFQNEIKSKNNINIKKQLLKSDTSLSGTGDATSKTQHFAYKKKILHKVNNFSLNIKDSRKNKASFNSSTSSGKKKNNSFILN